MGVIDYRFGVQKRPMDVLQKVARVLLDKTSFAQRHPVHLFKIAHALFEPPKSFYSFALPSTSDRQRNQAQFPLGKVPPSPESAEKVLNTLK